LGRYDDAIAWMERKAERMDALPSDAPDLKAHRYRYLANLGTFVAHRWLAGGADRKRIDEIKRAAKLIREAIELNPDAHFGREKYQLMALEWIASSANKSIYGEYFNFLQTPDRTVGSSKALSKANSDDPVQGVAGLIALGNAWESVDVFYALNTALQDQGKSSIAYLAALRIGELKESGKESLLRDPDATEVLWSKASFSVRRLRKSGAVRAYYDKARANADKWLAHRNAYMLERLKVGEHPDTHPGFWNDYDEIPRVKLPGETLISKVVHYFKHHPNPAKPVIYLILAGALSGIVIILLARAIVRAAARGAIGQEESFSVFVERR
jgi:tetratricopeptide (TPR) repeat protein